MIAYLEQQMNVTEQANLVTTSRFSSLSKLKIEKQRMLGGLFRQAYHSDNLPSE